MNEAPHPASPGLKEGGVPPPSTEPEIDRRRLVFVGGVHRSGTSLVHRCFADHPDVSGFRDTGVAEDEGQHLQTVYIPADRFGGPGAFGFRDESYLDENSPLVTPENAEQLLADWLPHWDTERRILVEKTPANLIRARFLQALFPGCHFIMVMRHPIAVSYATQKWTSRIPRLRSLGLSNRRQPKLWVGSLIRHWLVCHERFHEDRPFLEHVHALHYEDFVAEPQRHLDELYAFVGLPPAPLGQAVRATINDQYLQKWERRHTALLTRPYAWGVVRAYEDRVRTFGYSLRPERVNP